MTMWECMNDNGIGGLYCDKCADQYRTDNSIDAALSGEEQWENGAYAALVVYFDYDRDNTNCDSCGVDCKIDEPQEQEYNGEDSIEAVAAARYADPDNHFGRDEEYWS